MTAEASVHPVIRHGYKPANELMLHYAARGNAEHPLLLFLHGFPEFSYAWRRLMIALGDTHFCVAPDLPGYNLSSKPQEIERYRTGRLVDDVISFASQFSLSRKFTVVAHDWGAALAWALAIRRPELLDGLVILNGVHPGAFRRELETNPEQAAASGYINALRAEGSEALYAANDHAMLWRAFADTIAEGHLTAEDQATYARAWGQPGALTGMFNWYRAMRPSAALPSPTGRLVAKRDDGLMVHVPTLVIWGMKDTALLPGCIEGLDQWVPNVDIRHVPDASHWIVHQKPELVSLLIREWLGD